MSDEERRGYENLILLCYRHHVETNDIETFDVARMRKIKADHEAQFMDSSYEPADEDVTAVTREAERFWTEVRHKNIDESEFPDDIRMQIHVDANVISLCSKARERVVDLVDAHERLWNSADRLPKTSAQHWCYWGTVRSLGTACTIRRTRP
jgi:hypothetical protein